MQCAFTDGAPARLSNDIIAFLRNKAGEVWHIDLQKNNQAATVQEQKEQKKSLLIEELSRESIVAQTLQLFAGSKVTRVRQNDAANESPESGSEN